MSEQVTITHERTDDIPVIITFLLKMRVAELIDKHFPTNGNWTGLSLLNCQISIFIHTTVSG